MPWSRMWCGMVENINTSALVVECFSCMADGIDDFGWLMVLN